MELLANNAKHARGRPRKYGRPSKAVTLTLPEDVLARLTSIDTDLGRAIVSIVEGQPPVKRRRRPAEIASYGNHAVIVVTPVRAIKRLAGVQLVPIGNGRALISLANPRSIPQLELDIHDAIEKGEVDPAERQVLALLGDILRQARLAPGVVVEERTIIVIETRRQRPGRASRRLRPTA
jgi:hypothetical protein